MKLYKRDSIWYVSLARGKKRSLKTGDEREARRLFKEIQREYIRGKLFKLDNSERVTLEDFTQDYLSGRGDLADSTLRMDEMSLRMLADSIGGKTAVKAITPASIEKFKADCRSRGAKPVSVNAYLRHIRTALNHAFEIGIIQKQIRVKQVKVGKHLPRVLSKAEVDQIFRITAETEPELNRIIRFSIWTGCRLSEILGARWQDVDGEAIKITGKGDKQRMVQLLPEAIKAMGEAKHLGPVFQKWHPSTVSHRFKKAARSLGIEDIHFHNIRHTSATRMIESGIPLEVIQRILGHSDIATTQIYAQVFDAVVKAEMGKLKI